MSDRESPRDERTDPLQAAIGRAIRSLRHERDMSRQDLASESGVSYSYLSEIERGAPGKRVTSEILSRIADALGLSPSRLLAAAEYLDSGGSPLTEASSPLMEDSERELRRRMPPREASTAWSTSDSTRSELIEELERSAGRLSDHDLGLLVEFTRRMLARPPSRRRERRRRDTRASDTTGRGRPRGNTESPGARFADT